MRNVPELHPCASLNSVRISRDSIWELLLVSFLRLPVFLLFIYARPFLCGFDFYDLSLVHMKEFDELITVDPDFVVPFLL